jgi:FAD/FMN-containing dehydrogenase
MSAGRQDDADGLLSALQRLLGEGGVLTERSDLERYETGWRYGRGRAWAVVRPSTPEQVAEVVRLAHEHGRPTHPIGANTGLVGASNPDASGEQLVVSFERLNRTIEIDAVDRTVLCDAGVLLSQLNEALAPHGLFFPIDLGADPQIGGMVATNTGGSRLCRYGDVRHNLLGLEVVLPDGTRVDRLSALHKDNTDLDFKQLFVGTSGVYGFVTRARLKVAALPEQRVAALAGVTNGEAGLRLLQHLERSAGEFLSAFEAISGPALDAVLEHGADVTDPFVGASRRPEYALLVEFSTTLGVERLDLRELLEASLLAWCEADTTAEDDVVDVVFDGDGESFWHIRHQISESLAHDASQHGGKVLGFDVSVPRARMAEFTSRARELLAARWPFVRLCDFGHWADGGTHLNVVWREAEAGAPAAELVPAIQEAVYDLCVRDFAGSYSAEHGVGPHNRSFQERYELPAVRAARLALARHFGR